MYSLRRFSLPRLSGGLSQPSSGSRILVVHPSGRRSSSGPYLQALSEELVRLGHAILMLGERFNYTTESGVVWRRYGLSKGRLRNSTISTIETFRPDCMIVVGIRTRAMLAALQASYKFNLPILFQAEDDDLTVFQRHYPKPDLKLMTLLDTPAPDSDSVDSFIAHMDKDLSTSLWSEKQSYRLVEPVLRALLIHRANAFGAIWHPMADFLISRFEKPTVVIPPVVSRKDIASSQFRQVDRSRILLRNRISPDRLVFFLPGTIYDYSDEFGILLDALSIFGEKHKVSLIMTSKSRLDVDKLVKQRLSPKVERAILKLSNDSSYNDILNAADVMVVPGVPCDFNRLRLPARVPRAMAAGRPIMMFACGFGETLQHDEKIAVLTTTSSAIEWADKMHPLLDSGFRLSIGTAGKRFAEINFNPQVVAMRLSKHLDAHVVNSIPVTLPSLWPLEKMLLDHYGF